MDLRVESDTPGVYVVFCPEQMEWHARGGLVDKVREACGEDPLRGVIVDLGNVTFLSSAGIGALFSLHEFVQDRDARMVIARPRAGIRRLLNTVKLPDMIPTVKSLDLARSALDTGEPQSE